MKQTCFSGHWSVACSLTTRLINNFQSLETGDKFQGFQVSDIPDLEISSFTVSQCASSQFPVQSSWTYVRKYPARRALSTSVQVAKSACYVCRALSIEQTFYRTKVVTDRKQHSAKKTQRITLPLEGCKKESIVNSRELQRPHESSYKMGRTSF